MNSNIIYCINTICPLKEGCKRWDENAYKYSGSTLSWTTGAYIPQKNKCLTFKPK